MNLPLVTLFRSPNAYYLYDTNKNEIIEVSKKLFLFVQEWLNVGIMPQDNNLLMEIERLQQSGYFSPARVKVFEHTYTRYLPYLLDRCLPKITLQLTQKCNFRCKYCLYTSPEDGRQRHHSSKHMTLDTAKKAVDFLWDHSIDNNSVNIGFYGGEPLLEFELMKQITIYAEKKFEGKKITFTITTNGTLLNDEIVEFLAAHDFDLMISIDGPREINDRNRVFAGSGKGTFNSVIKRIYNLSKNYPDYVKKVSVNMVIDPSNDFDHINSLPLLLKDFGIQNIRSGMVDTSFTDYAVNLNRNYISESEYHLFLANLAMLGRIPVDCVSTIAYQQVRSEIDVASKLVVQTRLPNAAAPGGPCIPGQMRLFINADGDFFPCERVGEMSKTMKIGNLESGFDLEKITKLLNIGNLTASSCSKCWAIRFCKVCAKQCDSGTCLSAEKKLENCKSVKQSVYNDLLKIILFQEIQRNYH